MTQTYDMLLSREEIEALDEMLQIAQNDLAITAVATAEARKQSPEMQARHKQWSAKLELARGAVATLRNLYT